ncbi:MULTISPECIES: phosphoribosyltransferase [Cyanophyceae]|uniref:phosphoribosyltransferase n=1 Tax=Cyanophyceae TaxID=3028117 RepID=UPI001687040F|nr:MULTISPECIES: phosphoribosyltransferase [Cyanophyceae]MBD1916914.1 phosphoribosyltransferase [Phormidium sp. FACHB-77]MBD2029920.1 phosphoribosyltransferase [Phormidium sp. FACHB-322]MBD2053115.1 phosphoribosyltransferase [Leptolyngbya sp. FACHB-60]
MLFQNRVDAGQRLANLLQSYANRPGVIVIALPRGGVPVAAQIANALEAPLDVLVVRKLGIPGFRETAMGSIASGNFIYFNQDLIQRLAISPEAIDVVVQHEQEELRRREKAYRDNLAPLDLRDRTVILVDDGLATGATIQVAIEAVKQQRPKQLIVAVPVADREACNWVGTVVDRIICAETPQPFYAVGLWYEEFAQTSDDEVRSLLHQAKHRFRETASCPQYPHRSH